MIAFLIGGEGRFMDAMINKLNKDGHRVYLLTGTKNSHTSYQKVFEKYNFEYDSDSIREILVSANPDIVIFMGEFKKNIGTVYSRFDKCDISIFVCKKRPFSLYFLSGSFWKVIY